MQDRYFYHSFPRRGAHQPEAINKGLKILSAIRDLGFVLTPEYIEWKQPNLDGSERIFPILQKRVCFTELSPTELPSHSEKFGEFALEFDIGTLRNLGAIPVFYLPHHTAQADGNSLGVALLGIAMDASAVISRIAAIDNFNRNNPKEEQFDLNVSFARNKDTKGSYRLKTKEAHKILSAIGHQITPWRDLNNGMQSLLNFFYPSDNTKHDVALEYYRQREWRIASNFAIHGKEVMHPPTADEIRRIIEIDEEFFQRKLKTDLLEEEQIKHVLIHPGLNDKKIIEMVRRVIVPPTAVKQATDVLSALTNPPKVVSSNDLV